MGPCQPRLWETPLVFHEAEEIVPGSMADNEAKDRRKSMIQNFGQVDVNKPKPSDFNPKRNKKVTQVIGSECGEAGYSPLAIEQQPIQAHQHLQNHHEQLYEQNWTLYIYAQSQFTYYEMMQASEAQMMPCE